MTELSDIRIVYVLLFASTLLLVEGVFYLVRDLRGGAAGGRNRRLGLLAAGKERGDVLNTLRRAELDPVSTILVRGIPAIERLIREAGLTVTPKRLLVVCAAIAVVTGAILLRLTALPVAMAVLAGLAAGVGLPLLVLHRRRRQRLAAFGEQLPEALDMMVRSLQAGHPIASAIGMVAGEMADPAGSEFGIVVDEMTYGLDLHTALRNLSERIPHPDLKFFIVVVQIQHQTGGNLAEVLGNLATVIRDRFNLKTKVKVITAQGRSSAFVLALMPFLTIGVMNVTAKGYFTDVVGDPMFLPTVAVAGTLWALGLAIIVKLVHFRI